MNCESISDGTLNRILSYTLKARPSIATLICSTKFKIEVLKNGTHKLNNLKHCGYRFAHTTIFLCMLRLLANSVTSNQIKCILNVAVNLISFSLPTLFWKEDRVGGKGYEKSRKGETMKS